MTQVPQVLPRSLGSNVGSNDNDLTRLEAYRDYLRSTIASEERTAADLVFWLRLVMIAALAGIGMLLFLADKISATGLVWTAVMGGALIFILTLRVPIFGEPYHIGILVLCLLSGSTATVNPTARDLLADCEAKISTLKDNCS